MTPHSPGLLPTTLPMRPVEAMRSLQMAGNQDRQALSGCGEEKEKRCPTSLLPIDGPLTFLCSNYKCKFIFPKVATLPRAFTLPSGPPHSHSIDPHPFMCCSFPGSIVWGPAVNVWWRLSATCSRGVSGCQVLAKILVKIASVLLAEEPKGHCFIFGNPLSNTCYVGH